MCALLRTHFDLVANQTFFSLLCPSVANSAGFVALGRCIRSTAFELSIDSLLVLNFVLMVSRNAAETQAQQDDDRLGSAWVVSDLAFTSLFFLEMMLKLLVMGVREYISSPTRIFDAVVSICTAAVSVVVYTPNAFNNPKIIRQFLTLRLLRFARLINRIPQVRVIPHPASRIPQVRVIPHPHPTSCRSVSSRARSPECSRLPPRSSLCCC